MCVRSCVFFLFLGVLWWEVEKEQMKTPEMHSKSEVEGAQKRDEA